jgi:hypothetical protein
LRDFSFVRPPTAEILITILTPSRESSNPRESSISCARKQSCSTRHNITLRTRPPSLLFISALLSFNYLISWHQHQHTHDVMNIRHVFCWRCKKKQQQQLFSAVK